MPTDPVQGFNAIVQALRQRIASKQEKVSASKLSSNKSQTSQQKTTHAKAEIGELKAQIAKRLSAITPEQRRSKQGQRIFLESVLVWEFGDDITSDPAFAELAADIQNTIENEPGIKDRFAEMLEAL
jgi:hypothetical protein